MPTIPTDKIEGYENMTTEQKLEALQNYNFEDHSAELQRLQNAVTKANGEAAEWKRKHSALLTEEERAKQEREDEQKRVLERNAALEKELTTLKHKEQFVALGYSAELAQATAIAMAEGDLTTVFKNQKAFLEEHDKKLKSTLLDGTPVPPAGTGMTEMTKEKLYSMSVAERADWVQKNPEAYKQLLGGK